MSLDRPIVLSKLTQTRRKPAEWIGETASGGFLYAVARARHIEAAGGEDLAEAILSVIKGGAEKIKHTSHTAEVDISELISGLEIELQCEPDIRLAGELL